MKHACGLISFAWLATTEALQLSAVQTPDDPNAGWEFRYLDEKEVASRGSYCMDGSAPGYWYKEGSEDSKWTISFEGGAMYCYNEETCLTMMNSFKTDPAKVDLELYDSDEFKDYNHVQLRKCDGGIFMSDSTMVAGGQTLYLRGKRILDHTIEVMRSNTTFGSATDVMLAGGSGGGHAAYLVADYVKGLLPTTVKKYGAVPMSGWYASNTDEIEEIFKLHQMQGVVAPGCAAALSSEQHKCLEPEHSYKYSETPMFVVQMLDSQSLAGCYANNDTLQQSSKDAWDSCMKTDHPHCDTDQATVLQTYLNELVESIQSTSKYTGKGEGGFISTCTKHVFYKVDEYQHYANNGVIVGDAIATWWRNLGSSNAKWYWPCDLNVDRPNSLQCEDSCYYDSGETE